jgi:hypothetical protein
MCVYVDMYLGCWGNITHALEPKPGLGNIAMDNCNLVCQSRFLLIEC